MHTPFPGGSLHPAPALLEVKATWQSGHKLIPVSWPQCGVLNLLVHLTDQDRTQLKGLPNERNAFLITSESVLLFVVLILFVCLFLIVCSSS